MISALALTGLASLLATAPRVPTTTVPFPTGSTQTIHIVDWTGSNFPTTHPKTGQPPLSNADLVEMSQGGLGKDAIVHMIEERGCACDVSARALVRLKKAGVHDDVIAAASLQALPPNKAIDITVTVDFGLKDGIRKTQDSLYFFVDDVEFTRSFVVSTDELVTRRYPTEDLVDKSDPLLERVVRRVRFKGSVPLRSPGTHSLLVALSRNPSLSHPSELSTAERDAARVHTFTYPDASVRRDCRLHVAIDRDQVLDNRLLLRGSGFECEWD
jgi:hypothetical protein